MLSALKLLDGIFDQLIGRICAAGPYRSYAPLKLHLAYRRHTWGHSQDTGSRLPLGEHHRGKACNTWNNDIISADIMGSGNRSAAYSVRNVLHVLCAYLTLAVCSVIQIAFCLLNNGTHHL